MSAVVSLQSSTYAVSPLLLPDLVPSDQSNLRQPIASTSAQPPRSISEPALKAPRSKAKKKLQDPVCVNGQLQDASQAKVKLTFPILGLARAHDPSARAEKVRMHMARM